jgi:hypothetical protein
VVHLISYRQICGNDVRVQSSAGRAAHCLFVRALIDDAAVCRISCLTCAKYNSALSDAAAAVRKAESLLAPKGIFLATVPAFQLLWTGHDVINHHVRRYTKKALWDLVEGSGLRVSSERSWFQWLFPARLITQVLECAFRTQPNPENRLEYEILGRIPVPFGSSVMVFSPKGRCPRSDLLRL